MPPYLAWYLRKRGVLVDSLPVKNNCKVRESKTKALTKQHWQGIGQIISSSPHKSDISIKLKVSKQDLKPNRGDQSVSRSQRACQVAKYLPHRLSGLSPPKAATDSNQFSAQQMTRTGSH